MFNRQIHLTSKSLSKNKLLNQVHQLNSQCTQLQQQSSKFSYTITNQLSKIVVRVYTVVSCTPALSLNAHSLSLHTCSFFKCTQSLLHMKYKIPFRILKQFAACLLQKQHNKSPVLKTQ